MSNITEEQPLGSPDPEAVKNLLSGEDNSTVPKPLDLEPEVIRDLMGDGEPDTERARIQTPLNEAISTKVASSINMLVWSMTSPDVGEVSVTENEKALFLKAALNDTEITFPVTIHYGSAEVDVQCRTLSTWEMDVLYGALNADEESELFRDVAQYTTQLQQYILAMQAVKVNGKDLEPLRFEVGSLSEDIASLRTKAKPHVGKWSTIRWSSVLQAIRIFTIKLKLCTDAALNQDFWKPPGTV